jgi:hypothetical protein
MKKNQKQDHDFKRTSPTRTPPTPRYRNIFLGLCYSCNNFGHTTINYRDYANDRNTWCKSSYENPKNHYEENYPRNPHEAFEKNYNSFGALGHEIECYICNNFGHIAKNCRSDLIVFFASGNMSHFCLIFHVTSIFMSIVGRFFSTWFLSMVFYFQLRN